jgi:hypothetical protein
VLKAGFRKYHRRPQHTLPLGCELCALGGDNNADNAKISWQVEYITRQLVP